MSTSENIERETNRSGTGLQDTETQHGAPPVKVLVVDDHPVVRLGLTGYLSSEPGMTVVGEAASCQEACAMAASLEPDVVLLDLQLGDATQCDAILRVCLDQKRLEATPVDEFMGLLAL